MWLRILWGRKFLVVDDNALSRQLIAACLEGFGADHTSVTCGPDALDALRSEHFDAVILDIRMPGWTVFKTARAISDLDLDVLPPIIGLTANGEALADGGDSMMYFRQVVAKPFKPVTLFDAIVASMA